MVVGKEKSLGKGDTQTTELEQNKNVIELFHGRKIPPHKALAFICVCLNVKLTVAKELSKRKNSAESETYISAINRNPEKRE